jgi:hypothetical protein
MKIASQRLSGAVVGKPVYALCTLNTKTRQLKAKYFTMMIHGGSQPLWGIWSMKGQFIRYLTGRWSIEGAYPSLVWRRMSAQFDLNKPIQHISREVETHAIMAHYEFLGKMRKPGENVLQMKETA